MCMRSFRIIFTVSWPWDCLPRVQYTTLFGLCCCHGMGDMCLSRNLSLMPMDGLKVFLRDYHWVEQRGLRLGLRCNIICIALFEMLIPQDGF